MRRRSVPTEWREQYHRLDARAYRGYHVRGGGYTSRATGRCSCGAVFGKAADRHNMNAADVRDAWKDHVEDAYYALKSAAGEASVTHEQAETGQETRMTPRSADYVSQAQTGAYLTPIRLPMRFPRTGVRIRVLPGGADSAPREARVAHGEAA